LFVPFFARVIEKVTKGTKGFYRCFLNSSTFRPAAPIIPLMVEVFILQKVTKGTKGCGNQVFVGFSGYCYV